MILGIDVSTYLEELENGAKYASGALSENSFAWMARKNRSVTPSSGAK